MLDAALRVAGGVELDGAGGALVVHLGAAGDQVTGAGELARSHHLARAVGDRAQVLPDRRALAAELDVDGLVRVERYIVPPWSTAQAIGNIALVNIPLVRALNAVNLRISILEGRSGQVVWVREMQGEDSELDRRVDLGAALRNLDNAIPPQLRR